MKGAKDKVDYQTFVKMFLPITDKRFTTLIIQRSEKTKATPVMSVNTQSLAVQLVKSTAIFKKYKSMLDDHVRITSPSLSPVGGPEIAAIFCSKLEDTMESV